MPGLILEIVEGADAGRTVRIDRTIDIGRDREVPVALERDPQVEPRHARLTLRDVGPVLEDLGTAGGTFLNDEQVRSPQALRAGDRVRVGLTVLEVRSPEQVRQRPSAVRPRPPLPPQPAPPLRGEPEPAPMFQPGVGFRAEQRPADYVPPAAVRDDDPGEREYGGLTRMMDSPVKQQRNVAAFALLGTSALTVLLYFGLT